MAAAAGSGTKQLNECPTNVKEALEWLAELGNNGAWQCAQIIKDKNIIKGFDGKEAQELCQKTREFLSAIRNGSSSTYKTNGWSTMCQSSGGNCCGADSACQCKSNSSCDGCCKNCPQQMCARIFCLIVPVVRNVLMYLYGKCNTPRPEKGQNGDWASQKINNGSNGQDDLKQFMEACGFEAGQLEDKGGYTLAEKEGTLTKLGGALWTVNKNLTESLEKNNATETFLKDASKPSNAKSPNSICDLLLWLQFLPYSTDYKTVKEKLKVHIPKNSQDFDTLLKDFTSSIPMLFLFIEGNGSNTKQKANSLFQHIATLAKCQYVYEDKYYKKPEDVVKMLVSAMPVLYWSIEQMKDKCTQGDKCQSIVKDCEATKKILSSLGWNIAGDDKGKIEGNMQCSLFKDYIKKELIGDNDKGRLNDIKTAIENAWKNTNGVAGSPGPSGSNGSHLPRTIYEMLIWLMGLPVSGVFTQCKQQNGTLKDNIKHLTDIIFQVPNLFLTLNGDLSGMLSSMFQCHNIDGKNNAYQYGNDGTTCLKIFSAIVAILYPVIRYLQQRCKDGEVFKGESWQGTNTNAPPLMRFLLFMGFGPTISSNNAVQGSQFHSDVLSKIFGDVTQENNDKLKKLYECAIEQLKKNSTNGGTTTPTTIRQMMLWLIGLPVTGKYKNGTSSGSGLIDTVKQKANSLQNDLKGKINNGQPTSFQHQLQHSIVGMMTVISQIEGGLGSVLDFLKEGFKVDNTHHLQYQSGEQLFTQFTKYVTSVHVQLRFLKVMCKTGKDQGGWKECKYASNGACGCNGSVASCLKLFLQNGNSGGSGANGNKFKLYQSGNSEHLQMGFNQDANAPGSSQNLIGDHISTHLELMLDEIPTTQSGGTVEFKKPLSLLTQYCVAIGRIDPVSLGDHFDVFQQLAGDMWSKIKNDIEKDSLANITKTDTSGTEANERLKDAVKAVWPGTHTNTHDGDLKSLTGCNGGTGNPCSPFIATLSYGLYQYFKPEVNGKSPPQGPKTHIDWLYMKMSPLYGKLTALKTEMTEKCKCCPNGETKPTGCNGITQCPNCLPLMYKMGLVFGDPVTISTNKCSELMEKMKKVLDATSKLCVVFRSIDDKRFWPYLLFSAMVVQGKNEKGELTVNGDENINCYTLTLGGEMYKKYLKTKKDTDTQTAQENKTAREDALKCTCKEHPYTQPTAPQTKQVTPTTVTLTLYFKHDRITEVVFQVPHHGPLYNPLVRFYPRNLKSIVDWILRIGQTRLGQDTSEASTKDTGVTEMCKTLWPEIGKCLKEKDDNSKGVFKALIEKVMSLMGLENKGNKEVQKEVSKKLTEVKGNIDKKLKGGNGEEGFQQTFSSILTFKPKEYIDKVIEDFGKQVCNVTVGSEAKNRSYWCVAKAVSKCMKDSLQKIQNLAQTNKTVMANYSVTGIPELNGNKIDEVQQLTSINELKKLCDGFKAFHEAYKKVEGAFNDHLQQAQSGSAKDPWTKIKQCVEAFKELGECADDISTLSSYNNASQMPTASEKLNELSTKLKDIHEKLKEDDLSTFTNEVKTYIDALDGVLKKEGEKALAVALKGKTGGQTTKFSDFLKYYVSTLIDKMKENQIGDKNKLCDIHLRVRNDLLQLSECLKVMCEVCSTGMKDFANTLKDCVDQGKDHLVKIVGIQLTLKNLKGHLHVLAHPYSTETIGMRKLTEAMEWSIRCVRSLFMSKYIYQTQPIVSNFINNDATEKMTTYLKSLPDLIRDRYVLQKWKDDAKHFCGVQSFDNGIVKETDTDGIKKKLQELLKDIYHNNPESDITIHTFQVRSLIYNFCHKDGIKGIGEGVEGINTVNSHINGAQGTPNPQGDLQWTNISGKKTELLPLLTKLSDNAYLRYFATHLRDSVGYHALSNTLGALEQVKAELEKNPSSQPSNWSEISKLLHQKTIEDLSKRLDALVKQLNREYIFEYPPFDWQKSCQRLVKRQDEARTKRSTDPSPSTGSNTCDMCVPSMAHIFIGFVPQMYRLFKMLRDMTKDGSEHKLVYDHNGTDAVNKCVSSLAGLLSREGWRLKDGNDSDDEAFDLDASKKGTEICKFLESIITDTPTGVLLAQKGDASTANASLKPLDKLFKAVMQHFKEKRKQLRQKRIKDLEDEFKRDPKNAGLKFVAPLPQLPSTVRQVLFWLHELDTNKAFYDAMSQHIKALCQRSTIGISQETILHVLKLSITQCLEVLATIEDPGRHTPQYYYDLYTEEHYYDYPTVNIPLFFYTFVEKLMGAFLELNFVCVQCEFRALEGGWSECHIGKGTMELPKIIAEHECLCKKTTVQGSTDSRLPLNSFSYSSATAAICPRPLYSFLFGENTLKAPAEKKAYMSKGTMPCGFKLKNKAITDAATPSPAPTPTPTSVTGSVLVEPLRKLVGGHVTGRHGTTTRNDENNTLSTVIYLRDLLRYTLCLAVRPPWSMSENMAFFYRVTESWKKKGHVAHPNAQLLDAIHAEIALFPGTFRASLLTSAVERFAGVADEHQKTKGTHSNTSHHYDLRTLMGCEETNTSGTSATGTTNALCSPFMFPLALDVYTHYDEKNSKAYLSWILNFAFGIYGQLKALEERIKEQKCVVKNASTSTPSTCPSLPMCPGVLSALYQSGSSFMDQGQLAKKENTTTGGANTTKKTCNEFHTVLSGLFNCNTASCTPLHNLIVQCEAFLWSIRLPFSLVQLSLWSVAMLFISYVFVVPLDHFKIKSHLFNRLKYTMHPSLLIADSQRRVSEVAYFSL